MDITNSQTEINELKHWLSIEDIYSSPYVREWLERTAEPRRSDVLAQIAVLAQPEPRSLLHFMIDGCLMVFVTSEAIRDNTPAARKVGKRAALLLARIGDPRCLEPLARCFELNWFWTGRYQSDFEAALLTLLDGPVADLDLREYSKSICSIANRIWRSRGDLSDRLTELLSANLRCLQRIASGEAASVLERIAKANPGAVNRQRVTQEAKRLLAMQALPSAVPLAK